MTLGKAIATESVAPIGILPPAGRTLRRMTRIALVGPDGVGKSTVIALLRDWFHREFPTNSFQVRQWRPGLLPDLGRFIGKPPSTTKAVKPRRVPGKMHLVRVFYYYWDFLVGSWWKDSVTTEPGTLVIYDRCALDMQVDPVRFGLKSALGTRFLARFTPRPDLVICLEDHPDRIWQRKRDIEQHEMREQLGRWRRLAETGEVDAIVRVNGGAEEVAASVWQLVIDAIVEQPRRALETGADSGLGSLNHLLGCPVIDGTKFLPVPSPANPRFLIPLTSKAIAANALAVYNPQTFIGRLWRKAMSTGLRTGIVQRCSPTKLALATGDLENYLATVTGLERVVISISLGTPGVHQKPVFQVMDSEGAVRAFAKAGSNDATNELVRREAAALASLADRTFSTAIVPPLLDRRWHNGNYILVMAATSRTSHGREPLDDRHLQFLAELYALRRSLPADTVSLLRPIAERMRQMRNLGYHYYAQVVEAAVDQLTEAIRRDTLPTAPAHGDFSPWNIRTAGGKLLVLDWEYYRERVPAAHDLFHFLIGSGIELNHLAGTEMYRRLDQPTVERRHVENYLDRTGISRDWMRPLLMAYLAETLSSNVIRFGNQPSPIDAAARRAWTTMLSLAIRADGAEW